MDAKKSKAADKFAAALADVSQANAAPAAENAKKVVAKVLKKKVEQVSVSITPEDRKAILEISVNVFPILGKAPSQTKVYVAALKALASLSAAEQAKWFEK